MVPKIRPEGGFLVGESRMTKTVEEVSGIPLAAVKFVSVI
jgi:hypothetical protein